MQPIFRLPPYEMQMVATRALSEVQDWSIAFLGIPALWKETEGEGVAIAVLDTGADVQHPDLADAIDLVADFTGSSFGANDRQGHGTWCLGMIGARANDVGVRGIIPKCRLLSGKVLGDDGTGDERSIIAGIDWAGNKGADLISMSLGGPRMSNNVLAAIRAFESMPGHFVICAAGNEGPNPNTVGYPARWPETIAVAAVDKQGRLTSFSSRGPEVAVAAPGYDMLSTVPFGNYAKMSGTSMATPVVTGIVGAMLAKHRKQKSGTPLKTYQNLREHLSKTSKDAGPVGRDTGYGYGIIDPTNLLAAIEAPVELPPPASPLPIEEVTVRFAGQVYRATGWVNVA